MRYLLFFVCFLSFFITHDKAYSYRVEPLISQVSTIGNDSKMSLRVLNTNNQPLAVELSAFRRYTDDAGEEQQADANDDFIIFPPQASVAPGKSQTFRIQYVGDPDLQQSQTYTMLVEQLSLRQEDDEQQGIDLLINFAAVVHVVPEGTEPNVTVKSWQQTKNSESLNLQLHNFGNRYANLNASGIEVVSDNDEAAIVEGQSWREQLPKSQLLPDTGIGFELALPENMTGTNIKTIRFLPNTRELP